MKTHFYRSGLTAGRCPVAILILGLFLPLASVAEEPSKEDTIAWLHKHLTHVSYSYFYPNDSLPHMTTVIYQVKFEEGDVIFKKIEHQRNTKSFKEMEMDDVYWVSTKTEWDLKASLSELVPEVRITEVDFEGLTNLRVPRKEAHDSLLAEGKTIELSELGIKCRSGECFTGTTTEFRKWRQWDDEYEEDSLEWGGFKIEVYRDIAPRVQQALSHLIRLSGGKDEVRDDLF